MSATTMRRTSGGIRGASEGTALLPARAPGPNVTAAAQWAEPNKMKTTEQATSATGQHVLQGLGPRDVWLDSQHEHGQGHHADSGTASRTPHRVPAKCVMWRR